MYSLHSDVYVIHTIVARYERDCLQAQQRCIDAGGVYSGKRKRDIFLCYVGFCQSRDDISVLRGLDAGMQHCGDSGIDMERQKRRLEGPVYVVGCHTARDLYRHSIHKLAVKQRSGARSVRYQTDENTAFSGVHHHTAILQRRRLQEFFLSVCLLHYVLYAADRKGHIVIFIPHYYKGCLTEVGQPLLYIYYQARVVVRG